MVGGDGGGWFAIGEVVDETTASTTPPRSEGDSTMRHVASSCTQWEAGAVPERHPGKDGTVLRPVPSTVVFARETGVRRVVVSTGHSALGRGGSGTTVSLTLPPSTVGE